ncbi:MAG TPA: hypothetical protein VGI81_28090 [Tepidisphaeraceae bacterium]|jgi:hypothetical protein
MMTLRFRPTSFTGALVFLLTLVGLPFCTHAEGLYHVRPLSEHEVLQTYAQMLRDACHDADGEWRTSTFDPAAGYWGDGVSAGNEGIRTIGGMVLASGALFKYDDSLSDAQRRELLTKATAALRYIAATHITGTQKCMDGKSWGATERFGPESWQSGMWTGTLASGAWLMWDKLDPALQQAIEGVVAWEDDILARRDPPNGLWLDTKAEENAWEVPCLVLGEVMFPDHPHAAVWHEAALTYMMNTLCTEADTHDAGVVDGRPMSQWVKGANLQPDFTLENHNIFHPSYVGCSCYFMTQAGLYYAHAGRPAPQAAVHHLADTWRMFRSIILPWGEAAYPQGMDWELHGLPFINLFATLATRDKDPFAARAEQFNLQYMRAWQEMGHGSLAFPGSRLGITRHSINAEQAAYALWAHKVFGPSAQPMTAGEAAASEQGVFDHPYVDFIAHRTTRKFASFSWKNRVMGLLMPIGEGHDDNPEFTTPITNGFVGSFDLVPRGDIKMRVVEHVRNQTADGFETSGTVLLNGGRLKQTLRMASVGSQTVVYEDRVTALSDVTVKGERGVPIGIENDEITGDGRTVSGRDGPMRFDWRQPHRDVAVLTGSWANVDGRMGVVMLAGRGMVYKQASDYSRGISVRSDVLYGSFSNQTRRFKAGEEVARRIAVLFVEVTPQETAALAQSCKVEDKPEGRVLRFKQLDGTAAQVPLF